jgi:U4/U6 small nuclear ribonucleoprotein PRP4
LDFHPKSTILQSSSECNLASGSVDGGVHLWSLESDTPIATLEGHKQRVARLQFHPCGRFVGTASFDTTWRLYDVETQKELLLQEGHARELFTIGFQNDGALCATGGYDSIGRIWDLRSGQSIMVLREHIKPILALDWSPNGYELATGGEDNTIRIWDIRAAKCVYTIPAHTNTVTQVKYWHANQSYDRHNENPKDDEMNVDQSNDQEDIKTNRLLLDGSFIISSSYDGTCKLWADGDYKPLKSLSGLEGRLMCCDISGGICN